MDSLNNSLSDFSDAIKQSIKSHIRDLHVALPGIIRSFDSESQLASVQISIRRVYEEGGEVDLPIVTNVPVKFFRGGNFVLTMPVKVGDECLLIFSERDIGQWVKTGKVAKPSDYRTHSLSDGIALMGLYSQPNRITSFNSAATELRSLDGKQKVSMGDDGTIIVENEGAVIELFKTGGLRITNKKTGLEVFEVLHAFAEEVSQITVGSIPADNASALASFAQQIADLGG